MIIVLLVCTSVIIGPFLPFILSYVLLKKFYSIGKIFHISTVISLIIYFICIAVPYHFQGYADMTNPFPGEPIGWTKYPFIGEFSYLFSFMPSGFYWLGVTMVMILLSEASKNRKADFFIRAGLLLTIGIFLVYLKRYADTIGIVLE